MPIRQVAVDDKLRIWRNFQIGKLLVRFLVNGVTVVLMLTAFVQDLTMLDTRASATSINQLQADVLFCRTI